jgi:hypothetical protein
MAYVLKMPEYMAFILGIIVAYYIYLNTIQRR